MAVPAFEVEMHAQLDLARRELAEASACADTDGVGTAQARLADLIELAQRQGIEVAGVAM